MRALKLILFTLPFMLGIGLIGYSYYKQEQIDSQIQDPDQVVWRNGDTRVNVQVIESDGEIRTYGIRISTQDGKTLFAEQFKIDNDLWGGGFIGAVQADDDELLEILAWSQHEGGFLLDYKDTIVNKLPFSVNRNLGAKKLHALVREWFKWHAGTRLMTVFLVFGGGTYYLVILLGWGIVTFAKKLRRKQTVSGKELLPPSPAGACGECSGTPSPAGAISKNPE